MTDVTAHERYIRDASGNLPRFAIFAVSRGLVALTIVRAARMRDRMRQWSL